MRCGHSLVSAHSPRSVCTLPGLCIHSPGSACSLSSLRDEVRIVPGWVGGWRGDWSCCCRGIPQSAPEGLFLFGKILLLNPVAPSVQGRASLLTKPTFPARPGLSGSGPNTAQLSTLPSQRPQSLWVYHFVLIPLSATSSNQVSHGVAEALFGKGGSR